MESEEKIQATCFQWHWATFPELRRCLFHIPNGGKRLKSSGTRFKAVGVVAGIPDMCYVFNNQTHWLEFKTESGSLSGVQKQVSTAFLTQGYSVYTIRNFESFKALILSLHKKDKNIYQKA